MVDDLLPGDVVVRRSTVPISATVASGIPAVRITDIEDHENGCNEPELAAGDSTCGSGIGQGELSSVLRVGVAGAFLPLGASCDDAPLPADDRPLAALADVRLEGSRGVAATGGQLCLVLRLTVPPSAGNVLQTDGVTFSYQVGLLVAEAASGGGVPTDVTFTAEPDVVLEPGPERGSSAAPGRPIGSTALPVDEASAGNTDSAVGQKPAPVPGGQLSRTGAAVLTTLGIGAALVVSGSLALLVGRRRRSG